MSSSEYPAEGYFHGGKAQRGKGEKKVIGPARAVGKIKEPKEKKRHISDEPRMMQSERGGKSQRPEKRRFLQKKVGHPGTKGKKEVGNRGAPGGRKPGNGGRNETERVKKKEIKKRFSHKTL